MAKGKKDLKMDLLMKENILKVSNKVRENLFGMMDQVMKDS